MHRIRYVVMALAVIGVALLSSCADPPPAPETDHLLPLADGNYWSYFPSTDIPPFSVGCVTAGPLPYPPQQYFLPDTLSYVGDEDYVYDSSYDGPRSPIAGWYVGKNSIPHPFSMLALYASVPGGVALGKSNDFGEDVTVWGFIPDQPEIGARSLGGTWIGRDTIKVFAGTFECYLLDWTWLGERVILYFAPRVGIVRMVAPGQELQKDFRVRSYGIRGGDTSDWRNVY